ncbi:TPA: PD-(D/E)XK nuclease family protein [Proteus mirabilis]|uniref:PD-(D/E)XK nuclease family protein n=1 Tax=Proteus mirabilis TaxID=584 RepID=UPI001A1FC235|nr:PD-(D/E)XK nuclease family protein [Proteus mirabilis]EKT9734404.1 PD-(D/E)XK nuclease family protein [Proteus mirabilis]EKW6744486.1 PD-(D/E)XK nuclease family protein [Proteus mirabilis]MBI6371427.1 PD-(D/E)XK nuclease family protein [Proteus mirabilis]MCU6316172.1 PD-(D/E)XK nuclease family protein [Proteus mirabilis]HCT9035519.1 PD-(D/E)XK nuclease family protein [Proteus mirabilis]
MNPNKQCFLDLLQKKKVIINFINQITFDKYRLFLSIADEIGKIKSHYVPVRKSSNLIDILGIYENGHSAILAEILNFKEKGEYILLNDFIHSVLGYELLFNHQTLRIVAECDRIDILIYDEKQCIIVENKINNAIDQPEQLKRYIDKCKFKGYKEENINILYLTDMSIKKDLSKTLSNYSEYFKEKIKIIAYHPTIIEWLTSSVLPNIKNKDNDFYCFNSQYIDHLNGRFFKRPKDETMNNEINDFISKQFDLKEDNIAENITILESELKLLNELQSRMNTIILEKKEKIFKKWTSELKRDFPLMEVKEGKEGELTKTGILINNNFGKFSILIEKNNSCIYFGIGKHFTDEEQLNDNVIKSLSSLLSFGFKSSPWWYGWKYTSYERGYSDLCQLINDFLTIQEG